MKNQYLFVYVYQKSGLFSIDNLITVAFFELNILSFQQKHVVQCFFRSRFFFTFYQRFTFSKNKNKVLKRNFCKLFNEENWAVKNCNLLFGNCFRPSLCLVSYSFLKFVRYLSCTNYVRSYKTSISSIHT